jgi:hypothetical protein
MASLKTKKIGLSCLAGLAGVLMIAVGQVQALPINPGFETGDFTGWTSFTTTNGTLGHPGAHTVTSFDVTGSGASNAARFQVGQISFQSGVNQGGGIYQNVAYSAGMLNISADIAAFASGQTNLSGGVFRLLVNGIVLDTHDFGSIGSGSTERNSLSGAILVGAGLHQIRFEIGRPFTIGNGLGYTPFQYIDNVVLNGSPVGPTTPTPEPSTMFLLGSGLVGLVGWRLKKK